MWRLGTLSVMSNLNPLPHPPNRRDSRRTRIRFRNRPIVFMKNNPAPDSLYRFAILLGLLFTARVQAEGTGAAPQKTAQPVAGTNFNNGTVTEHVKWLDTSGNLINAHDG